jgi:hypothetical protein
VLLPVAQGLPGVPGEHICVYTLIGRGCKEVAKYFPVRAIRQYGLAHLDSRGEATSSPASQLAASLGLGTWRER